MSNIAQVMVVAFLAGLLILSGITARSLIEARVAQVALTVDCPQDYHIVRDGTYIACVERRKAQ